MGRAARRLEPLDDQHAAAAMWAGMVNPFWARRFLARSVLGWLACRIDLACRGDELASTGDLLGAGVFPIGEQAVVPDAVESLGQDVHEEPAHELAGLERHGLVAVRAFETIVLVFERDAIRVGGDQAAVGDGDAMSVAGKVG